MTRTMSDRAPDPSPDHALDSASVLDAADRLAGLLVRTPMVGEPVLPGLRRGTVRDLRLKVESVQVGGGVWTRGATMWLLRQLGRCQRGTLVAAGDRADVRPALCAAAAARTSRIPLRLVAAEAAFEPRQRALLEALADGELVTVDWVGPRAVEEVAGHGLADGLTAFPVDPAGAPEVAAGVATVGLEIAGAAPSDAERLYVGDSRLVEPVTAGLVAGGRDDIEVVLAPVAADGRGAEAERTVRALADGCGMAVDRSVAGAVLAALAEPSTSPVLVLLHA